MQTPFIEKLGRDLLAKLGVTITDLDFTCCPYYAVKDVSEKEWLVAAARNLAVAEKNKTDIISLCNGCSQTLIEANEILKDKEKLAEINGQLKKVGLEYKGTVKVLHFMMLLSQEQEKIKQLIKKPLRGVRVATHTGCHLLRPSKVIGYDSAEDPKRFDELVSLLGAISVDYLEKTTCCGSTMISKDKDMSLEMMKVKLSDIHQSGADCLSVCCPSCFMQYDRNQILLKSKYNLEFKVPTVHILQLLGIAFGHSVEEVFLNTNRSMTEELLIKLRTL